MLKKYKNGFVDIVKEAKLSLLDFNAQDTIIDGLSTFVITYRDSPLKFIVLKDSEDRHSFDWAYTVFAPDFHLVPTFLDLEQKLAIQDIYSIFKRWLAEHVMDYIEDCGTHDLWEQAQKAESLVNGDKISGNELTEFSVEEKVRLRQSISEFRQVVIANFSPSAAAVEIINDRLDYLNKALDRLNRFDWRGVAISSLISITIALSLDTQKGHLLYELFRQVFATALCYLQP